ncbi:MAG: hypothetical protein RJA76_628 [Bacteroidota bacterium]|jgi:uncharacterized protein (DUF1684 family)
MKSKSIWLILIPLILIIIYISIPKNDTIPSETTIDSTSWVQWKKEKNESLKMGEESPIINKKTFSGLMYYPYNSTYILNFKVQKATKTELVNITMTDGTVEQLAFWGTIEGQLDGKAIRMKLFQHENGELFLPFKDKTAPQETYGGGRYVDIPISNLHDSGILIDFNYAYNPYCAYNKNYACPIPPKENQLEVRIESGEKITPSF